MDQEEPDNTPAAPDRELSEEELEQAEIERVFGPVDEKQQDVEQVTGLSETYLLKQFFLLFISIFIMGFVLLHFSVLFRPNLPHFIKLYFEPSLTNNDGLILTFDGVNYSIKRHS